MTRNVVIIQARMGSTRLPGKIMLPLCGKTVLEHDINRVSAATRMDDIVVATTTKPADDVVAEEALRLGVKVFRGSEDDVLSRYYLAAKAHDAETIIRITSDCPLYDPQLLDEMIGTFQQSRCDYLSNCLVRSYPRGLDTEIFTFAALEKAYNEATEQVQKEHVTPYINQRPELFLIEDYVADTNHADLRWTLDTQEDFDFITAIYNALYPANPLFTTNDILQLLEEKPALKTINAHIEQKKLAG